MDLSVYLTAPLHLYKICRACLSEKRDMEPLFGACLDKMLMSFANIQVSEGDGLPNLMCEQCVLQCSRAYTFKQLCEKSDTTLRQYMSPEFQEQLSNAIAEESKVDLKEELHFNNLETVVEIGDNLTQEFTYIEVKPDLYEMNPLDLTTSEAKPIQIVVPKIESPTITENKYQCRKCNDSFVLKVDLKVHMMTHPENENDHICEVCQKAFPEARILKRHLKIHLDKKPHQCDMCEMSFAESSNLSKHKKKHTSELPNIKGKPHLCSVCGRAFKWASTLKKHIRVHTGFQNNTNVPIGNKESARPKLDYNEVISLIQERKQHTFEADTEVNKNNSSDEDEFACRHCTRLFDNTNDLITHEQTCLHVIHKSTENGHLSEHEFEGFDNASPFKCSLCNSCFKTKIGRNQHMSRHEPVTKRRQTTIKTEYMCDLCNKILTSESKLATHFRRHAANISRELADCEVPDPEKGDTITDEVIYCYICNARFLNPEDLKYHVERQHTKSGLLKCEQCNENFLGEIRLVQHLRKHRIHLSICKICLKRFDSIHKLKEHMKSHGNDTIRGIFKCPICKDVFRNADDLRTHCVLHANDIYECTKCKRTFNNKVTYESHEKQHTEPKFLCPLCGKQYFSNVTFACHIRSHNNEKPFVCSHCKKGFSSRTTLSVHERIHSAIKPYVCSYCGYSCRQSSGLAMHIRTHTGVKPYKCTFPNCDRMFTTSSQRKEHYRRHTNERNHKCHICGKAFLESTTLKMHMLTHTGEKPHECEVCGKKFRRTHHLTNHMKGHKERE